MKKIKKPKNVYTITDTQWTRSGVDITDNSLYESLDEAKVVLHQDFDDGEDGRYAILELIPGKMYKFDTVLTEVKK